MKLAIIKRLLYLLSFTIAATLLVSSSHAAFPKLELELINENEWLSPVGIVNAGDASNRLFIIEQRGQIRIIDTGTLHGDQDHTSAFGNRPCYLATYSCDLED